MDIVEALEKFRTGEIGTCDDIYGKAIAEINTLRQQLAKPAVEWISVKDKLPEFTLFSGEALKVMGNEIPPLYRSERVLYQCDGVIMCGRLDKIGDRIVPHEVTHWMPIPAAYDASKG